MNGVGTGRPRHYALHELALATTTALTWKFAQSIKLAIMPTYEYVCDKCGKHFEQVQLMSANPLTVCPKDVCQLKRWGKGKVARAISGGGGLIFKGSGFYITDYRSEKYKEAAKKDSAASTPSGSGSKSGGGEAKASPTKTETKPAKPAAGK